MARQNKTPDPLDALITTVSTSGEEAAGEDLVEARRRFSEVVDAGRPWEQLPSRLKAAGRADMRRLVADGRDPRTGETGYSARAAGLLLRDIGLA